ncbi:MAG TPA: LamG domain-containing protein, partial [Kofleriaceae bacterium]
AGNARVARCIVGANCPTQVAGVRGNGLAFNGMQGARVTYGAWLATPTAFSIAGWIYLDVQVDQVAFAKPWGSGSLDSWGITAWAPPSTAGTCLETVNAAAANQSVCGPILPAGRWFHVVGRWDGTSKALFIDGVKAGELPNATVSQIDNHDMLLGGDENMGMPAYQFQGQLDEVQIYDRALTDPEIAMLATP